MTRAIAGVLVTVVLCAAKAAAQDARPSAGALSRAEQGDPYVQNIVAAQYDLVEEYVEAVKWYRRSAEQGNASGQAGLGEHYWKGQGVPQDFFLGEFWTRKAADQGDPYAGFNLAIMYRKGEGVPKNLVESVKWETQVAEQECWSGPFFEPQTICAMARLNLAAAYFEGEGIPQDFVLAHMWTNLAAASLPSGEQQKKTAALRDDLARRMTPQQVAEAQRLAREWKPRTHTSK